MLKVRSAPSPGSIWPPPRRAGSSAGTAAGSPLQRWVCAHREQDGSVRVLRVQEVLPLLTAADSFSLAGKCTSPWQGCDTGAVREGQPWHGSIHGVSLGFSARFDARLLLGESHNHRIPECWGLAGPSVGHPAQPPAQAGSPRAGCTAPWPGGS